MSAPFDRGPKRGGGSQRGPVAALVAVVVIVVVLYLVGQAIVQHNATQNCIDSGRRDCDKALATP